MGTSADSELFSLQLALALISFSLFTSLKDKHVD